MLAMCARTCGPGCATTATPVTFSVCAGAGWIRPALRTKLIFDIIHLKPGTLTARRFGLSWSHDFRDFLGDSD